jgi:hypothetical protein
MQRGTIFSWWVPPASPCRPDSPRPGSPSAWFGPIVFELEPPRPQGLAENKTSLAVGTGANSADMVRRRWIRIHVRKGTTPNFRIGNGPVEGGAHCGLYRREARPFVRRPDAICQARRHRRRARPPTAILCADAQGLEQAAIGLGTASATRIVDQSFRDISKDRTSPGPKSSDNLSWSNWSSGRKARTRGACTAPQLPDASTFRGVTDSHLVAMR